MRVLVLESGSLGNATIFEAGGTRVLVDGGIGVQPLADRMRVAGMDGPPDAIVVTHGHQDHVGQSVRLSRKLKIPIYASEATSRIKAFNGKKSVRVFGAREPFTIGALTVSPLPIPHDADQVALVIEARGRRACIVTDLGEVPPDLPAHLAGCEIALIESNHDVEMLRSGPYPAFLKRRIASARGHLSNVQAHALLRALPQATHSVVLMHLSRTNNRPEIALASAQDALAGRLLRLIVAGQSNGLLLDATARPERPLQPSGRQLVLFP